MPARVGPSHRTPTVSAPESLRVNDSVQRLPPTIGRLRGRPANSGGSAELTRDLAEIHIDAFTYELVLLELIQGGHAGQMTDL